jgi:hypothetical protein
VTFHVIRVVLYQIVTTHLIGLSKQEFDCYLLCLLLQCFVLFVPSNQMGCYDPCTSVLCDERKVGDSISRREMHCLSKSKFPSHFHYLLSKWKIIRQQWKQYASYEDIWLRFSRMGFILFYFVQELMFIKSKNWNEEVSRWGQNIRWLADSLALSRMKSPVANCKSDILNFNIEMFLILGRLSQFWPDAVFTTEASLELFHWVNMQGYNFPRLILVALKKRGVWEQKDSFETGF